MNLEGFLSQYPNIISALTAIGTVGAVMLSLYLTVKDSKRFRIQKIEVYRLIKQDKKEESNLGVTFENLQNVQMEVISLELWFVNKKNKSRSGSSWKCRNEYIAPLSQAEIRFPLNKGWQAGSLRASDKTICIIKTSYGEARKEVSKRERSKLFDCLED